METIIDRRCGLPDARTLPQRIASLVLDSDTTPVKFILMAFSLLQSVAFFDNIRCHFVACEFLRDVMPYEIWGSIFAIYGLVELWRIFDGKSRPKIAQVINACGAFLFGGFTTALLVARWPQWILAVPDIVLAFAAMWVFVRTAFRPERGFRGD